MAGNRKNSWKLYPAWGYEKEIEDLNRASEQGWQLVRGGCFHSSFVKNPNLRYRYQMDFGRIDDMGRYIETFREQGWEYVNSTFNKWHYFRKLYDPALPEEDFEIFTDRESLREMRGRWGRLALAIAVVLAGFAVYYGIHLIQTFQLPLLIQTLVSAMESGLLVWGWTIMRNPDRDRSRRYGSAFLTAILAVIVLGAAAGIAFSTLRPHFQAHQSAGSLDEPMVDSRWAGFEIKYRDNYFLDLDFASDAPMTFSVLNEAGQTVYTQTGSSFREENIRLQLPAGHYCLSVSCEAGYRISCIIQ